MKNTAFILFFIILFGCHYAEVANDQNVTKDPPNVIIIMADDQGYGDLSINGNPVLKTPYLDKFGMESVRFSDFHVAPMCTPTRGELMTGIDAMRNGATAVCQGHSMFFADIPIMPEYFKQSGYATGIFGKWHLGDSYPHRPQDNGFDETLSFPAWGITSLADHFGNSYFDPYLRHNGIEKEYPGYCTDIFFDEAKKWIIEQEKMKQPFFVYLPLNVAHFPELVEEEYSAPYEGRSFNDINLPANFYGMIGTIDRNMKELDQFLLEQELKENTIIIYLSDNGTQNSQAAKIFNANMREWKTSTYEGGHRVPLFIRWPKGNFPQNKEVSVLTQVQDILPTLIDLCQLKLPESAEMLDGKSLAGLLVKSEVDDVKDLTDRKLVIQYSLGETAAEKWHRAIVLWEKWRLVGKDELYNIESDPSQQNNLAIEFPDIVSAMSSYYDNWYAEVKPIYDQHRYIHLGNEKSLKAELFSSDWDGGYCDNPRGLINANTFGKWYLKIEQEGEYEFELSRWPDELNLPISAGIDSSLVKTMGKRGWYEGYIKKLLSGEKEIGKRPIRFANFQIGSFTEKKIVKSTDTSVTFRATLKAGNTELETLFLDEDNKELCSAIYVKVEKI